MLLLFEKLFVPRQNSKQNLEAPSLCNLSDTYFKKEKQLCSLNLGSLARSWTELEIGRNGMQKKIETNVSFFLFCLFLLCILFPCFSRIATGDTWIKKLISQSSPRTVLLRIVQIPNLFEFHTYRIMYTHFPACVSNRHD